MSPEKRPRPKHSGIEVEEEKAWVEFYRRVRSDADLASEVLVQLERDAEMKRTHLALYLSCKESLRRFKAQQTRHKRIGSFVRWLARALIVSPWQALRSLGGSGRDIAIELLPEPRDTPRRSRHLPAASVASGPSVATPRRSDATPTEGVVAAKTAST